MKKEKRFVPDLALFMKGDPQTDLVTGKKELLVRNLEITHYF